ncbi:hypothetical protein F5880DRAFT_1645225, partial [Lentinula raphanica]
LRGQIAVYHSRRSSHSKRRVLEEFRSGQLKILLTTEAAGMGCDLPSIHRVVQFMVPKSLAVWLQRAGRAARSTSIQGQAFLLVQPSVFQEKKSKESVDADSVVFRKDVEAGLRLWIETSGCRREVSAEYFHDGVTRSEPTGLCCDNCIRKSSPRHPMLQIDHIVPRPPSSSTDREESESGFEHDPPVLSTAPVSNRRHEHLAQVRARLTAWRDDTFDALYDDQPWGPQALLPPSVLTAIATKARLHTIDDLISIAGWEEVFAHLHGAEKIERAETRHRATLAKREEMKRIRAEEKVARDEAKRVQ